MVQLPETHYANVGDRRKQSATGSRSQRLVCICERSLTAVGSMGNEAPITERPLPAASDCALDPEPEVAPRRQAGSRADVRPDELANRPAGVRLSDGSGRALNVAKRP